MKLSVVLPCYNEQDNLRALFSKMEKIGEEESLIEFIVVNNGSKDNSQEILEQLVGESNLKKRIKIVRVLENQGYGYGILEGLKKAQGDVLSFTHADMQTDLKDVVQGFSLFKEKYLEFKKPILVKGNRTKRGFFDKFFSMGMEWVVYLFLKVRVKDINAQPKIFSKEFYLEFVEEKAPWDFSLDLFLLIQAKKIGKIIQFDTRFLKRQHGEAKGGGSLKGKIKLILRTLAYIKTYKKNIRVPTMMAIKMLEKMIEFINQLGKNSLHVQDRGGNFSWKSDLGKIHIKSTGKRFQDVSLNDGLSSLGYHDFEDYRIEKNFWNNKTEKPSLEVSFHIRLKAIFILHTHHTLVNILLCSREGEAFLKKEFPQSLILEYKDPGLELARAIPEKNQPDIIFLKNHGLIVATNSFEELAEKYSTITKKVETFLKDISLLQSVKEFEIEKRTGFYRSQSRFIQKSAKEVQNLLAKKLFYTPDQAVFLTSTKITWDQNHFPLYHTTNLPMALALEEILENLLFIGLSIKKLNYTSVFLDTQIIEQLVNREDEKIRIQLAKTQKEQEEGQKK